jgi:hypothetical protein
MKKIVKTCQFYSDSFRFFTTNCTVAELKFRAVFFCHFNKISVNHLLVS